MVSRGAPSTEPVRIAQASDPAGGIDLQDAKITTDQEHGITRLVHDGLVAFQGPLPGPPGAEHITGKMIGSCEQTQR